MVEPAYRGEADEELRAGGVGIWPARHRDHAALVTVIVELGLDIVTRSAFAVAVFFCRVFRIRIAALNHESFDDPVENGPVVKALAREFLEVFDRVRCRISPKLHHHIAFAGFDHCDFIGRIHRSFFFFLFFSGKGS